jgi:integrase/recombinase XerD
MTEHALLGPWVRRFLLEHLVAERNLAANTQRSYRDTLRLLLPFAARSARKGIDRLQVEDLSAARVRAFLGELGEKRGCGAATRNQRLAAIRSLAYFVGVRSPEHVPWCAEIRSISFKKAPQPLVSYLEKAEMDALLAAAALDTAQSRRDHALLLFLYNTGARADEVAHVQVMDLDLGQTPGRDPSSVLIHGKGNKQRRCPLWARTVTELLPLVSGHQAQERVFRNRRHQPLTRFGIHALVERYARVVAATMPSMAKKRVSPHTIRHTTAMHLLQSGVDLTVIALWLGHESPETTHQYVEADLRMKEEVLGKATGVPTGTARYQPKGKLLAFLDSL